MADDIYKAEHDLIQHGKPLINQMGADMAVERSVLNNAVKDQLMFVEDLLQHYLPTAPRGWGDDTKMPHEWGSMDTYDDMRNRLRLAALMMDTLLDPFAATEGLTDQEVLQGILVLAECGLCAVAAGVLQAAGLDDDNDYAILARRARQIEKANNLEPNSLFPSDQ